jgi:hypothetical protein
VSSTSPKAHAIDALLVLVHEIDPMYRPAEFLLGYTCLSEGDASGAIGAFTRLVQRFDDELQQHTEELSKQWLAGRLRWTAIAKHIPFVKEWAQFYADAVSFLHGGTFVSASETWSSLKALLDDTSDSSSDKLIKGVNSEIITMEIGTLSRLLESESYPAIAAGRAESMDVTQKQARDSLDFILDKHKLSLFDNGLQLLDIDCMLHSFGDDFLDSLNPANPAERLNKLLSLPIATILESALNKVKLLIDQKDWLQVRQAIREIRRMTRERSPREFAAVLDNAEIESGKVRIAALFIPALRNARRMRADMRQPLYMESNYYLAQSLLMTFELEGLKGAYEQASTFRRKRLPANLNNKWRDLYMLTLCLEIEALVRWGETEPDSDAGGELSRLQDEVQGKIKAAALDERLDTKVRAAAFTALGMLERWDRRGKARAEAKYDDLNIDRRGGSVYAEVEKYRQALELRESSSLHCYMAEVLLEGERNEDARSHIRQALLLAPKHALANRMAAAIEETVPDPAEMQTGACPTDTSIASPPP